MLSKSRFEGSRFGEENIVLLVDVPMKIRFRLGHTGEERDIGRATVSRRHVAARKRANCRQRFSRVFVLAFHDADGIEDAAAMKGRRSAVALRDVLQLDDHGKEHTFLLGHVKHQLVFQARENASYFVQFGVDRAMSGDNAVE